MGFYAHNIGIKQCWRNYEVIFVWRGLWGHPVESLSGSSKATAVFSWALTSPMLAPHLSHVGFFGGHSWWSGRLLETCTIWIWETFAFTVTMPASFRSVVLSNVTNLSIHMLETILRISLCRPKFFSQCRWFLSWTFRFSRSGSLKFTGSVETSEDGIPQGLRLTSRREIHSEVN